MRVLKKADGTPMTDYSWRVTDEVLTCWHKAHSFYIPNGLFGKNLCAKWDNEKIPKTVGVAVSSKLYQSRLHWIMTDNLIAYRKLDGRRNWQKNCKVKKDKNLM